jgi:HEAT repeat protein
MVRKIALVPFLLAACATSGPELRREAAPELETKELETAAAVARHRDFQALLIRLDQAIDSYVQAVASQGEHSADNQATRLERMIHDAVLDLGAKDPRDPQGNAPPRDTFKRLDATAKDGTNPKQQAIALAALGFSGLAEAMPTIVQGAMLENPDIVDSAVLGLAVLRSPRTPTGVLAAIARNQKHPEDGRAQAAWALYRIQGTIERPTEILAVWQEMLTNERDLLPASVLMTAVRGLGLARDPSQAELVASFLRHPTPRLRMNAALALGRMNAQQFWPQLLDMLGPQETVQNVRLWARKALAELAGGVDHGYDLAAWRKTFDRG